MSHSITDLSLRLIVNQAKHLLRTSAVINIGSSGRNIFESYISSYLIKTDDSKTTTYRTTGGQIFYKQNWNVLVIFTRRIQPQEANITFWSFQVDD
jgi:hypothetical protein